MFINDVQHLRKGEGVCVESLRRNFFVWKLCDKGTTFGNDPIAIKKLNFNLLFFMALKSKNVFNSFFSKVFNKLITIYPQTFNT